MKNAGKINFFSIRTQTKSECILLYRFDEMTEKSKIYNCLIIIKYRVLMNTHKIDNPSRSRKNGAAFEMDFQAI